MNKIVRKCFVFLLLFLFTTGCGLLGPQVEAPEGLEFKIAEFNQSESRGGRTEYKIIFKNNPDNLIEIAPGRYIELVRRFAREHQPPVVVRSYLNETDLKKSRQIFHYLKTEHSEQFRWGKARPFRDKYQGQTVL